MTKWRRIVRDAAISGTTGSLVSTAALTACGWIEQRRPAAPNNGPSQWVWGELGAYKTRASWRHTGVGVGIHFLSSLFWAMCHERCFGDGRRKTNTQLVARALVTAGAAAFVDYRVAPRRLMPGFDKQLSRSSLFVVYAAFALGLALPALLRTARRRAREREGASPE